MNNAQSIYDFLCRYEQDLNKGIEGISLFQKALDINSGDRYLILKLRAKLADHVFELVDFLENEHKELNIDTSWSRDVIKLLTCPIDYNASQLRQISNSLFPHGKNFIGLQIGLINKTLINHKKLSTEDLLKIKEDANSLVDKILSNENLEPNVRNYLIKHLRKITEAVEHYQIYGNEGIIQIIEESIGHTFINKDYQDFMKSEKSEPWKEYLANLSLIVATSESVISIGTTLKNLIS